MKRRVTVLSLSAAAALLLSEQVAWSSDTIWELLRNPQLTQKRAAVVQGPKPAPTRAARRRGATGVFQNVGTELRRLGKILNTSLKVQGQKSMGLHFENISGSGQSYQNDVYYGRRGPGGMYDQTDVTVTGKVFGLLNFETRYSNNLYGNPYDNRVSLNYAGKGLKLDAGDINGAISGNSLTNFSRTLQGVQFSTDLLRHVRVTGLVSQTKAQTRTITLPGGNGAGPYPVYVGQIVDGTDHVRVNNHEMRKGAPPDGDYTLDPFTGTLMFSPGTIIAATDTIAITFETYGYNQSPGMLTGWRVDGDLLKSTRVGLTYLAQTASRGSSGTAQKTDQFYGYGDPQTPYTLSYPVQVNLTKDSSGNTIGATPVYPMQAWVGGDLKTYGVDFTLDPLWPNRVYFRAPIPSTLVVKITYTPAVTDSAPGNRSVMGLDSTVSLGKMGAITAEMATSRLDLSGRGVGGDAWQLRSDMRFAKDRLHWSWSLRDIAPGFAAIESPGFNRNDRGIQTALDYTAAKGLRFTANIEKTKRPSYGSGTNGGYYGGSSNYTDPTGSDDYTALTLGANWQLGTKGQLNFNHTAMSTRLAAGGNSTYGTDTLAFGYRLKALTIDMSVGRNTNDMSYYYAGSAGGNGNDPTLSQTRSNSLTERLNLAWRPSDKLNLGAVFANSSITGLTSTGTTSAQNMQFTADYAPLRNMRLRLGYQLQNSGTSLSSQTTGGTSGDTSGGGSGGVDPRRSPGRQATGGGTGTGSGYNPYGSGYGLGGGGVNSGLGGFGNYSGSFNNGYSLYASTAGNTRALNLGLSYQPVQALTMDVTWSSQSSEGAYLYNSRGSNVTLNLGYSLGERLSFNGSLSLQRMTYIGSTGGTSSNMMFFTVHGKPIGKLATTLGYQVMRSNSSVASTTDGSSGTGYGSGNPFYGNGAGTYTSGATNLTSYNIRFEYPLWRGNNLFVQHDNAQTSGFWASDQRTTMFGVDFDLRNNMKFTLGWRYQEHLSRDSTSSTNSSYRVGSLDADVTMRF